jgi:hypothetical protein
MGLEEEAIKAALLGTNRLMPGEEGPLLPSPQQLIEQGNLKSYYAGGATQYERPGAGMPLGATSDPSSPRGYTIADPLLREQASRFDVGLASGVAQNQYMDAFERDKLKNTLAIMQASQHLPEELQMAVMQRLGINVPGYDQGGGGGASGSSFEDAARNYMGARQTGVGPTGDPTITPMFAQGNPTGGYMSRKLREEIAKLQFEHQLKEPTTQADIELKRRQGEAATATAGANIGYKQALEAGKGDTYKLGLLGVIDNITAKYQAAAGGPGIPGNPVAAENLKRALDILMSELERTGGAGAPGAGVRGGPPGSEQSQAEQTPWWDRGMPSGQTFTPNQAKVAELQRQLAYMQQYAPNDTNTIMMLTKKLQNELTPGFATQSSTEGGVRSVGPGQGITVRKNTGK